jgi:hypothetical protein
MSDIGKGFKDDEKRRQADHKDRKDRIERQLVLSAQDQDGWREGVGLIECLFRNTIQEQFDCV